MPDVEFLGGDESPSDDEVLDTGPKRPVPRWVLLLGVLVIAAVIVVVVARRGGGGTPVADPSTPDSTNSSTAPAVQQVTPNLPVPNAYALVGDDRDHRLFAVSDARLYAFRVNGLPAGHGVSVQLGLDSDTQTELLLDSADHVLYAVPQNTTGNDAQPPGTVEAFDTRTLRALGHSALPARVEGAAVLDGSLYLTTAGGLYRLPGPGTPPEQVAGRELADTQLVADPARDRLLALDIGATTTVRTLRLGHLPSAAVRLPSRTGTLAVVDGTIWASGLDVSRPELAVLDPTTLQPGRDLAAAGTDVTIQGTGRHSLFVTIDDGLRCLAGSTGRTLHDFGRVRGDFATVDGHGFVGTISALHPLAMGRCPG